MTDWKKNATKAWLAQAYEDATGGGPDSGWVKIAWSCRHGGKKDFSVKDECTDTWELKGRPWSSHQFANYYVGFMCGAYDAKYGALPSYLSRAIKGPIPVVNLDPRRIKAADAARIAGTGYHLVGISVHGTNGKSIFDDYDWIHYVSPGVIDGRAYHMRRIRKQSKR